MVTLNLSLLEDKLGGLNQVSEPGLPQFYFGAHTSHIATR